MFFFLSSPSICQQRLLQRPTSTRMPIQMKSTTTSTSAPPTSSTPQLEIFTVSRSKHEHNGPTSTFDDLLNSFQKEPTSTTTRRPQLTTFSDADDIAFLKGLVRIKSILLSIFSLTLSVYFFLSLCLYFRVHFNSLLLVHLLLSQATYCLHSLFSSNWIRALA